MKYNKIQCDPDELKIIFDQKKDGISLESYRVRRLNTKLKEKKIPYSFHYERCNTIQELVGHLNQQGPVPVFFSMRILHFTYEKYNVDYKISLGNVFDTENKHVMIFVGYEGDKILFVDPSYQLPFISDDPKNHYIEISDKDFFECRKHVKDIIMMKYNKKYAKQYKRDEQKKL